MDESKRLVARWEAKGGKRFLELHEQAGRYSYEGDGCGGTLRPLENDEAAVAHMEAPWGSRNGTGPVTVLKSDFPSVKRVV